MIELILEALVDLGLIREDYKHHKKITKKEKEDGKKRPFQRYLLQPSTLVVMTILILGSISIVTFFIYQHTSIYPENTKKELFEMTEWVEKYKDKLGEYPRNLKEVIGNNPTRQHWNTDSWNRPYKYVVLNLGKDFLLLSAGPDGEFETEDDISAH